MKTTLALWCRALVATLAILAGLESYARAQFQDARVQPPQIAAPERGSLAGPLAGIAFGPAELERGAFTLPLPIALPLERGTPMFPIAPAYSPEGGQSEWGMGVGLALSITRFRAATDLGFDADDDLASPWGTLTRGEGGAYFVRGLRAPVRVVTSGEALVATLADGTRVTFGKTTRETSARGTYAWFVDEVESVNGRKSIFSYTKNASGRVFLASVTYGGLKAAMQHRVSLVYEPRATPFLDYRSGEAKNLDQRVKHVVAETVDVGAHVFRERYRYDLGYQDEGLGPAFFLASVQRTFASGAVEPKVTFAYERAVDVLSTAVARKVDKLDTLIARVGTSLLGPTRSAVLDANADGLPDLEAAIGNTLYVQGASGFEERALGPIPPGADSRCRFAPSPIETPRTLMELRASDRATYVVHTMIPTMALVETAVTICTREGIPVYGTTLPGLLKLGPASRLVDVTRDHQPDFVRVEIGRAIVLPNTSSATSFSFGSPITSALTPAVSTDIVFVQDMNGDGLVDVVGQTDGSVRVWHGLGGGHFASEARELPVRSSVGGTMAGLRRATVALVDVNHDGLADMLVGSSNTASLYVNTGDKLVYADVPGLRAIAAAGGRAMFVDFAGSGEAEVFYTTVHDGQSIALTTPGTGLLASADDGRGNALAFDYARSAPVEGMRARPPLLSALTLTTTGQEPLAYTYAYAGPKVHGTGRFLVGFESVSRRVPLGRESSTFFNDDDNAGLLLTSVATDDAVPALERVSFRSYDDVVDFGLPWKRLRREGGGLRSTDATRPEVLLAETEFLRYDQHVCPSSVRTEVGAGTRLTETSFVTPVAFAGALSCISSSSVLTGTHADATLDFRYEARFERNEFGQTKRFSLIAPDGSEVEKQTTRYTDDGLVTRLASPGQGASTYEFDAVTRLPTKSTAPDGSVVLVVERDPLTSAIRALRSSHGALSSTDAFRFDGRERLAAKWHDRAVSASARPNVEITYQDATSSLLAASTVKTLVDTAAPSSKTEIELAAADGATIAKVTTIPEGFRFDAMTLGARTTRSTRALARHPTTADPRALDLAALAAGTWDVGTSSSSALGLVSSHTTQLHADVEAQTSKSTLLDHGRVDIEEVRGGGRSRATFDAAGLPLTTEDPAGRTTRFTHDALGRLRRVVLADGSKHAVDFDELGRLRRHVRDGVATLELTYDGTTDRVHERRMLAPLGTPEAGRVQQSTIFGYDDLGRVSREVHRGAGQEEEQVLYFYDGATPEGAPAGSALGLLTGIRGDGYAKTFRFRGDAKEIERTLSITGHRGVRVRTAYAEDGTPNETTTTILDAQGATLASDTSRAKYDAYGRSAGTLRDGHPFATNAYDVEGLPLWTTFEGPYAHGQIATYGTDPISRIRVATNLNAGAWSAAFGFKLNGRGLLGENTLTVKAGAESTVRRVFGYGTDGLLASADDTGALSSGIAYTHDALGALASSTTTTGGSTTHIALARAGQRITAGPHQHAFDAIGRAVERDDVTFRYAPSGQLKSATRAGQTWTYLHDERGMRIAKLGAAGLQAMYLDGDGVVEATTWLAPVATTGPTVGVLRRTLGAPAAELVFVPTDGVGSTFADAEGAMRLATPYGVRAVHSDVSAALDFAAKGWDNDLGTVRMGVRDYDPNLGRWLTPDPLFFEHPEKCVASPLECGLYGYARGNPVFFSDPWGLEGESLWTRMKNALAGVPLLPFFVKDTAGGHGWKQYTRPEGAPPGSPNGLAALRQLNAGGALAVAQFSREVAPGTSVENLTVNTVGVIAGATEVCSAAAQMSRVAPVMSRVAAPAAHMTDAAAVAGEAAPAAGGAGARAITDPGLAQFASRLEAAGIKVTNTNISMMGGGGRVLGEIDVVTENALIQFKNGPSSARAVIDQVTLRTEPFVSRPVITFINDAGRAGARTVNGAGSRVLITNDFSTLVDVLR